MADGIRGDGLIQAQRALHSLMAEPERLDHARTRFDESPPPYVSDRSGTTTRSQSPGNLNVEEQSYQARRDELYRTRAASWPRKQFFYSVVEERKRLWSIDPRTRGTEFDDRQNERFLAEAQEAVKMNWIEQGIWNDEWNGNYCSIMSQWKHQLPMKPMAESETEYEDGPVQFLVPRRRKAKRTKTPKELHDIAERQRVLARDREASRPYHQLMYQVSLERERMQNEPADGEDASLDCPDINTRAYERVKKSWIKRNIWNKNWGIIPGASWMHELPFDELCREQLGEEPVSAEPMEPSEPSFGYQGDGGLFGQPANLASAEPLVNDNQATTADMSSAIPATGGSGVRRFAAEPHVAAEPPIVRDFAIFNGERQSLFGTASPEASSLFAARPSTATAPDTIDPYSYLAIANVDFQTQCAVSLPNNLFCASGLCCTRHSLAKKRAVVGRFAPFDELLGRWKKVKEARERNEIRLASSLEKSIGPSHAATGGDTNMLDPAAYPSRSGEPSSAALGPMHASKVKKPAKKGKSKVKGKAEAPQEVRFSSNVVSIHSPPPSGIFGRMALPSSSDVAASVPPPSPPLEAVTPRRSKRIAQGAEKAVAPAEGKSAFNSQPVGKTRNGKAASSSSAKSQGVKKKLPKPTKGKVKKK